MSESSKFLIWEQPKIQFHIFASFSIHYLEIIYLSLNSVKSNILSIEKKKIFTSTIYFSIKKRKERKKELEQLEILLEKKFFQLEWNVFNYLMTFANKKKFFIGTEELTEVNLGIDDDIFIKLSHWTKKVTDCTVLSGIL